MILFLWKVVCYIASEALIIQGQIRAYFWFVYGAYLVVPHSPIHLTSSLLLLIQFSSYM